MQTPHTGTLAEHPGERIARRLARAGLCSRREAERWIVAGRVCVDGHVISSPALNVAPGQAVTVDGQPLPAAGPVRLWLYHKPAGLIATTRDPPTARHPQGRPTVFDHLPPELPRVMSVGRLDINTEGLLLLTNDGALARRLELPATGWRRRYRARAFGGVEQGALDALGGGLMLDGMNTGPVEARLERVRGGNCWIAIAVREGRNREVKRILEHLGLRVNRLIRVSYGPFQLGGLKAGEVREVPPRVLRDQLGGQDAPPRMRKAQNAHRRG